MGDAAEIVKRYVELLNSEGSPTFELFGDQVEWLEVHSGRRGGRDELFAAMNESRQFLGDMHVEVRSLIADGDSAALEAEFSGKLKADGTPISVPMVYVFGVRGGKIIREIDYVVMPTAG